MATCAQAWLPLVVVLLQAAGATQLLGTDDGGPAPVSSTAAAKIEVAILEGGYGIQFFAETARQFERLRPDVRVDLHGDPRIAEKVRMRLMEGAFPDACDAFIPWATLIQKGQVLDLVSYMEQPNWEGDRRWRESFLPGALDLWSEDGHVWAVPFGYGTYSIFYNRKMFHEYGWQIPRTWTELLRLCERIKVEGIAPFAFPGVYMYYADMILAAAHYNLVGPGDFARHKRLEKGSYTDRRFKRAGAAVQELARHHFQEGWEGMSHTSAQLQFFQGHTAMMANGSWLVSEMQGKIPEGFDLGQFNFPVFEDGIGDPNALGISSTYYYVSSSTRHPRETVDFLRYLTSRERTTSFTQLRNSPTAVRGVALAAYGPLMRDLGLMIEQSKVSYSSWDGLTGYAARMDTPMNDARHLLLTGRITPDEFGDMLEAAAGRIRQEMAHPDSVEINHPWAGSILLVLIGGIPLYALCKWAGRGRRTRTATSSASLRMRGRTAILFLGPALLLYALFVLKPGLAAFGWSLTDWDGLSASRFVGLLQFRRLLFEDDALWTALRNNLFVMTAPMLLIVPLSLFFAALMSRGIRGRPMFQFCFLFPNMLGSVAISILWMNACDPKGGLVNGALVGLGRFFEGIGLQAIGGALARFENFAWLSPDHLYTALVPIMVWGGCGFYTLLYLAAMDGVDPELYDAASVDGASAVRQFFSITIPMIWDVIVISAVFMVIAGMKTFEMIWLLTSQHPTSQVHVAGTLMVSSMLGDFNMGRATAIAVILFLLVLCATLLTMRWIRRDRVEI